MNPETVWVAVVLPYGEGANPQVLVLRDIGQRRRDVERYLVEQADLGIASVVRVRLASVHDTALPRVPDM